MRIKQTPENALFAGRTLRQIKTEESATELLDRVRCDLQGRGIAADLSDKLAVQVCQRKDREALSPEQYEALIDGAALACGVYCDVETDSAASASQVREIERMMQAFAGELGKLDESLEVLATYVRRMRRHPAPTLPVRENQTLH